MKKAIIYYTSNRIHEQTAQVVRDNLYAVANMSGVPIVSVVQKKLGFGDYEIVVGDKEATHNTIFWQLYIGCCAAWKEFQAEAIFTAEHDVLYYPGYFDYTPVDDSWSFERGKFYMDNVGFKRIVGHSLSTLCTPTYKIIANFSLRYYRGNKSMHLVRGGFRASEPGETERPCGWRTQRSTGDMSCIDIRHSHNFSRMDLSKRGGAFTHNLPHWGNHTALKRKLGWCDV